MTFNDNFEHESTSQESSISMDKLWRVSSNQAEVPEVFHETDVEKAETGSEYFSDDDRDIQRDNAAPCLFLPSSSSLHIPESNSSYFRNRSVKREEPTQEFEPHPFENIPESVVLHTNDLFKESEKEDNFIREYRPSSSPLVPLYLKFEDIKYKVMLRKGQRTERKHFRVSQRLGEKNILSGISGSVGPGEILAMMGPSGSGKTTLLNILGGRLEEQFTGSISYNGLPYNSALKRRIGFVTQDDVLFPILTVKETLVFAALLRLSKKMTLGEKIKRAQTVLQELGLERCQNTMVGGPFVRGVSGGERKRTSIGYEILVDPSLLLLDEPTSGLDSATALKILQVLRNNAQIGRVIVTTIHQPSSRMFVMFDKLLLLSEGHPLYFGESKEAMKYFSLLHFIPQIAMNPADFLLDLATGITSDMSEPADLQKNQLKQVNNYEAQKQSIPCISDKAENPESIMETNAITDEESHKDDGNLPPLDILKDTQPDTISGQDFQSEEFKRYVVMKYLRMKYRTELDHKVKETLPSLYSGMTQELMAAIRIKKSWTASWFEQFLILCKRNSKERRKDYFNILRFTQGVAVAMLLGLLWWRSKLETLQEVRDQMGLLFYITIFWCTFSMYSTLMVYPTERNYLAKERAADMYRLSAYYVSSTLCDLLAELIHPTLFMAIVYFMTGLQKSAVTFVLTVLSVNLITISAQGFGDFFGALTLNVKSVGIVASFVMLIFLLAGGYYVQNIPVFMKWLKYLSIVFYGYRLLEKVQYSPDQTYDCLQPTGCKRFDSSPMFEDLDLNGARNEILALITMAILYRVFAYVCLRRV